MAFVHSLVKTTANGRRGWCAPSELGEAAPHYISFVLPVDENEEFFPEYTCEMITSDAGIKRIAAYTLVKEGKDSFLLRFGELDLWFTVRAVPKEDRRLPYVGKLGHPDFASMLTEIEPEEPQKLDNLYDAANAFVIGCEPFAHYSAIRMLAAKP